MGNTISQCLSNSAALDTSFSCSQLSLQGCSSTDKPLSWSVSSLLWQQTKAWFKITSPVTFNCLTIKNGADRTCGLLLNKRCQETFSTSLSFQQHLTLCMLSVWVPAPIARALSLHTFLLSSVLFHVLPAGTQKLHTFGTNNVFLVLIILKWMQRSTGS